VDTFLNILDHPDACSTTTLIVILVASGSKFVANRPVCREWGKRLAGAAFILYTVSGGIRFAPRTADDWVFTTVRGLVASGYALGISWLLTGSIAFVHEYTAPALSRLRTRLAGQGTAPFASHAAPLEDFSLRLQQDAARQEREQAENQRKAETKRRRTDARAAASLTYSLYAPKLGNRFTQEMLDRYFKEFMGEDHSADDVERRGRELLEIIQKLAVEDAPAKPPMSLAELTTWYLDQKQQIEPMQVDERLKRAYLADLNKRYRELASLLLEKLEP
jgi:hypothetical protein